MVWMSEVSLRRKPSLSASKIATRLHLRHVQALAQQVDAHQHVELTQPQIANELGALHGLNVGMQVIARWMPRFFR